MLNKKDRTMERYIKAGAEMRLLKTLGGKIAGDDEQRNDMDKAIVEIARVATDELF